MALLCCSCATPTYYSGNDCEILENNNHAISLGAFKFKLTVTEAEIENTVEGVPFKYVIDDWNTLKQKQTERSEIWYIKENYEWHTGYVLIENCTILHVVSLKIAMM